MAKVTRWYYHNERFIICDCKTCGPNHPMVVYRLHAKEPSDEEKAEILKVAMTLFKKPLRFRGYARQIPMSEHWHEHLIEVKTG